MVDLNGTGLMPQVSGQAKVEAKRAVTNGRGGDSWFDDTHRSGR